MRYTSRQFRYIVILFAAYTAAYISRTNLSPAMDAIQTDFGLTAARVGLLPTCFALHYALGQIVSGTLADHFPPRIFIFIGLMGSAAMNVLFSWADSFLWLLIFWALNGCFQSMIWTPIVRVMAAEYEPSIRPRAMFTVSLTLIVGYLAAWALSGSLTAALSWRWAFRASGMITAGFGTACFLAMRDSKPASAGARSDSAESPRVSVWKLIFGTDLFLLLIGCVFNGFVRDSIMNWAPKMLADTQGIDLSGAVGVALVIPIVNFLGIQAGKATYRRMGRDVRRSCAALLAACAGFSMLLTAFYRVSLGFCTLLLGLCSAMAYGINPLLTSFLPMDYDSLGRVALTAGLIDATIYLGSACSGVLAGYFKDAFGWQAVFASWAFFSLLGVFTMGFAARMRKKRGLNR